MAETNGQEVQPEQESPAALPALTPAQIDEIIQGNLALQEALDRDPAVMAELETVIREHTRRGITPTTLQAIYQGLGLYLGTEGVEHLLSVLTRGDDSGYLEQVSAHATPQTWNWLRRLLALYSSDLQEAYAISGVTENAWRLINRRAYFDTVTGRWGVTLEFITYGGERLLLDETPGSALVLALAIVDTLNTLPTEVAPEIIDRDTIEEFTKQSVLLCDLYAPGMIEEWAAAEEAGEPKGE